MNVSGVPQKVNHYSLTTAAGETSPHLCTVYGLSSVHRLMAHCCLNVGALPQSSGTTAEFIKAELSVCGERRERKAGSAGRSVTEFACIAPHA